MAAAAPTVISRFFGFAAESTRPRPADFTGPKRSMLAIQPGSAVVPPRGRRRHCSPASTISATPSRRLTTPTQVAGSLPSLPSDPPERSRTIVPTTERPTSQPSRNDDPLTPPRGVASIRTTAMIGIGLRATPSASGRTAPIALPMVGSLLEDPHEGRRDQRGHGTSEPRVPTVGAPHPLRVTSRAAPGTGDVGGVSPPATLATSLRRPVVPAHPRRRRRIRTRCGHRLPR